MYNFKQEFEGFLFCSFPYWKENKIGSNVGKKFCFNYGVTLRKYQKFDVLNIRISCLGIKYSYPVNLMEMKVV